MVLQWGEAVSCSYFTFHPPAHPAAAFTWPSLRWHLNRSLKVSYQLIPGLPLHISLGLLPRALDFLALVVLDAWFPSCFGHFLLPYTVPHFQPLHLLSPRVSPFSLSFCFQPLSLFQPPSPFPCLRSATAFSLGCPRVARLSWDVCQTNFRFSRYSIFF